MKTVMANLPSEVGAILRENISVIAIVSVFSLGAYNALEPVLITLHCQKLSRFLLLGRARFCHLRHIYISEATRALKSITRIRGHKGRKVIIHLLWVKVNVLVVALKVLLLLTDTSCTISKLISKQWFIASS